MQQISGERLQDHWSSGLCKAHIEMEIKAKFQYFTSGKHVREMYTPLYSTFI